jgi:beta-glucosidase
VYIHQGNPGLPRPVKELKGFEKVFLEPNRKHKVSIPLDELAFAFYDPARKGWVAEKGSYTILVGASSRDIRLESGFELGRD